jgi:hypothetical protein
LEGIIIIDVWAPAAAYFGFVALPAPESKRGLFRTILNF